MLSSENHPPDDPNEISREGVDLSIPSLDDHNPLPNFSIRDYVLNARSKDIKTNWPFSEKSLQLCLNHGVKDILPPLQHPGFVKNQSCGKDGAESSFCLKGKVKNSDGEPLNIVGNIDLSGFESCDKHLLVTANNLHPEEVFPKPSEMAETHFPKKSGISKPPSTKKCKLIVKVGPSGVEPSTNSNSATIIEAMAAPKVCPICKIFSSSSNTTLNAHIDQCLSMDSPIEPSSKSRVVKHRIKPRKTRLMVDIYATALHCTLEELDRRNGRIWCEKPSLPTIQEDALDCGEEKKQSVAFYEKGDKDAVYIDANGTKLRILNKISDTLSVSKLEVNPRRLGKPSKGGKGSKLISTYKRKKKHNKCLKVSSQKEKACSYKIQLASRVVGDQEKVKSVEVSPEKDKKMDTNFEQSLKSREQTVNSGTKIPKWASFKRTRPLKRQFKGDLDRSYAQKIRKCYGIPHSSLKKGKRIGNSSCEGAIGECHEQPPLKKQMRFKSFRSKITSVDRTFSSLGEEILSVDQSSTYDPNLSKNSPFRAKNVHDCKEKHLDFQPIGEDGGQIPPKRSTILKIKKKKSPVIGSHRHEFTQDRDIHKIPPPRAGAHFEDGLVNTEPPRGGNILIGQSSGADAGNIMSLAKSFDQDFHSIGKADMETEMDSTDLQENYFSGVDPITIPGPPGSFLPSPGRMNSDEDDQGNSSLTTSQVQSLVDHLEMVDRDSSNSPKSFNSTVLNSLIVRSDSKLTENLSLDPGAPQDEIKLGFSDEITNSTLGFQDDQPCCCSQKKGVSVNYPEYELSRPRVVSSFPDPTVVKQSNSYPSPTILPIDEPGLGSVSVKVPVKPHVYGDFGSPSPSSPNPILRLMGKDLMVVNNVENLNHGPNSKFQAGPSDSHVVHQVTPLYGNKAMDLDHHEYKPNSGSLNGSWNSPFSPVRYNRIERVVTLLGTRQRNEESVVHKHMKEVIVIDDAPENEVRANDMHAVQTSSAGFPIPTADYYNPRHLNPFYSYQGSDFLPYRSPHVIPNASSSMPSLSFGPTRGNNSVVGDSSMLPRSSSTPSPSINHARSSLYFSPSLS